ncbi:DUF3168 domain-containing protein [Phaeobacter gallaeciensis]|uniref:tail completion protein gp17 n=1 Tax=Phaeobacter gallaeciensis TaxID=60890 RepID=UPI00237FD367|nr:DUF3168 domain-containing protein [Phaeobacter gallaeciensis]MDE4302852.1 DUF3168 domain-containing protein [Phaeobacter gallaeciensis]MDE4307055.1 DUF3168 domain-containing protein [Phaeobacter gallaeciensis]MDE4311520.1 DUF3168 domain-containing protein [Phaeobacter gallaeciensis]MDE4316173.1 DUF3168 domain-containing protein [Phaeobacter gallaeciensis]MDE4320447.1 DUF3168 domain-containing protein [Phaeobacter gallaeciensis]
MEADIYAALAPLATGVVWGGFDDAVGFPRITIQRVSNATDYTLKGRSGNETARIQINIYSQDADELFALAPQVSQTLTSFRGGSVIRCKEISRRDGTNESGGDVVRLQMLDFQVRYRA